MPCFLCFALNTLSCSEGKNNDDSDVSWLSGFVVGSKRRDVNTYVPPKANFENTCFSPALSCGTSSLSNKNPLLFLSRYGNYISEKNAIIVLLFSIYSLRDDTYVGEKCSRNRKRGLLSWRSRAASRGAAALISMAACACRGQGVGSSSRDSQ